MDPELKRLLHSAFVQDTLFRLAGTPHRIEAFGHGAPRPNDVGGDYNPNEDLLRVRRGLDPAATLQTMIHEEGHRLVDSLMRDSHRGAAGARLLGSIYPAFDSLHKKPIRTTVQRYAATDPNELAAEAFRAAANAIRTPNRDSAIAAANREVPGTAAFAKFLIQRLKNMPLASSGSQ